MPKQKAYHVLVVDDDPQVLKLFSRILKRGGYTVTAVRSGRDALRQLKTGTPVDVIVTDLDMPDIDGFGVLRSLRFESDIPILAVSGCLRGAFLKPAELLGAAASLSKVEAPKLLLSAVADLLGQDRAPTAPKPSTR